MAAGISCGAQVSAQEVKTLTMKEAIELTRKNSKLLKLNSTKILQATAAITEANERRLPEASASAAWLYLPVKPTIDLKSGSDTGSKGGGPSVHQAMYGILNFSVPLYTGGKLKYGIESAKLLEQAVKLDAVNDSAALLMNTITACVNLFKAKEAITLVKENLEQSKQRVKDLSNLEKNGLLARNDLMKAELQSSTIELALLDAESNFRLASVNMNLMMGLPEQTELVPDRSGLALPESIKTLDEYEQAALQQRNDLAAIGIRKKAAGIAVLNAKSNYYPNIALTGGYVALDVPKFVAVTNAVNIGIGVKYDIASLWKTKTKIQQAQLKVQEVQANEEMMNEQIRLQVNQAFQAYIVSRKKIEVYEKSILQATENYRVVKNKYDNSLATTTELLEADVALLQAKLSVTNAKADSFIAYNRLLNVSGLLK